MPGLKCQLSARPYTPGGPAVRKMLSYLHMGTKPAPDPRTFYLDPGLSALYRDENEALNWERILRYLIGAR
ncbi:MAG: hypothetical protein ABSF23_00005 [Terracidiphilus sp.]